MRTLTNLEPNRLHSNDIIPGRGIVTAVTTTADGTIAAHFTNGNQAHYQPGSRLTVHRPS